jgi:hypothetical protein
VRESKQGSAKRAENVDRMNVRRFALLFALACALLPALSLPVAAAPTTALSNALSSVRDLSDSAFDAVVQWARAGATRPVVAITPADRAESNVLNLGYADRQAVLEWLRGNGRSALYARGASDGDIGSRRPRAVGPAPTASPNPYRLLLFGSPAIGDTAQGNVAVFGGWAAVREDARGAHACISFRNTGARTATRILFEFPISDKAGAELGKMELDRRGTFSPGVNIHGWESMSAWQQGTNRSYDENCTALNLQVAAIPLRSARVATYRILRVEYADGTAWTPAATH